MAPPVINFPRQQTLPREVALCRLTDPSAEEIRDLVLAYKEAGLNPIEIFFADEDGCTCHLGKECKDAGKHGRKGVRYPLTVEEINAIDWECTNVALTPSDPPAYIVLDFDRSKGKPGMETFALWSARDDFPRCPMAYTGSKGAHIFLAHPKGADGRPLPITSTAGKLPGVDIRGRNTYVVAAPSRHRSGNDYRWVEGHSPFEIPMPEMPQWMFLALFGAGGVAKEKALPEMSEDAQTIPVAERFDLARAYLGKVPHAVEGDGGDEQTLKAASVGYAYGLTKDEFWPALLWYNETRCDPKWDEVNLRKKLDNAYKYNRRPFGWYLEQRIQERKELERIRGPVFQSKHPSELKDWFYDVYCDGRIMRDAAGLLWGYDPKVGYWRRCDSHFARFALQTLIEATPTVIGKDGGPEPFQISEGLIQSTGRWIEASNASRLAEVSEMEDACVVFQDCVLHLKNGELIEAPHSPEFWATTAMPYALKPQLTPEESHARGRWEKFLADVFEPNADQDDRIKLLQEFVGACIMGIAARYRKALMLFGPEASNGKSTFMEIVRSIFPPAMASNVSPKSLSGFDAPYYAAMLFGARINVVAELPEKFFMSDVLKQVLSGEMLSARRTTERPFNFRPIAGHIYSANALPTSGDNTKGFWSRYIVLTFDRVFGEDSGTKADVNLRFSFKGQERALVLWAIEGARRLVAQGGYTVPESHAEQLAAWRRDSDPVEDFVQSCCSQVGETYLSDIFQSYSTWAESCKRTPMSLQRFATRLKGVGVKRLRRDRTGYVNQITVKPQSDWQDFAGVVHRVRVSGEGDA